MESIKQNKVNQKNNINPPTKQWSLWTDILYRFIKRHAHKKYIWKKNCKTNMKQHMWKQISQYVTNPYDWFWYIVYLYKNCSEWFLEYAIKNQILIKRSVIRERINREFIERMCNKYKVNNWKTYVKCLIIEYVLITFKIFNIFYLPWQQDISLYIDHLCFQ